MKIKLVAYHLDLYYEWKQAFKNYSAVEIIDGDILEQVGDALVSPANSFGYMDGGLDLKISQKLGWQIEESVRIKLEFEFFGELPVGNAIIVETGHQQFPYLISAPTMRVPSDISNTVNAYLAFKAVIQAVLTHNRTSESKIETVVCPGLGTGEGKMSSKMCANQMLMAYQTCLSDQMIVTGGLAGAVRNHLQLLGKSR